MFGIDEFTAIINPPNACILAIGSIRDSAPVVNGRRGRSWQADESHALLRPPCRRRRSGGRIPKNRPRIPGRPRHHAALTRIAHISDIHFGRIAHPEIVDALVRDINAANVKLVVVSGDLTQRAFKHQFKAARQMLDAFDAPTLVVPGNHDVFHGGGCFRVFSIHCVAIDG